MKILGGQCIYFIDLDFLNLEFMFYDEDVNFVKMKVL